MPPGTRSRCVNATRVRSSTVDFVADARLRRNDARVGILFRDAADAPGIAPRRYRQRRFTAFEEDVLRGEAPVLDRADRELREHAAGPARACAASRRWLPVRRLKRRAAPTVLTHRYASRRRAVRHRRRRQTCIRTAVTRAHAARARTRARGAGCNPAGSKAPSATRADGAAFCAPVPRPLRPSSGVRPGNTVGTVPAGAGINSSRRGGANTTAIGERGSPFVEIDAVARVGVGEADQSIISRSKIVSAPPRQLAHVRRVATVPATPLPARGRPAASKNRAPRSRWRRPRRRRFRMLAWDRRHVRNGGRDNGSIDARSREMDVRTACESRMRLQRSSERLKIDLLRSHRRR